MISEEMLQKAAAQAALQWNEQMPLPEECSHTFRPGFEKRMRKLLYRANHPGTVLMLRWAASIAILFLLGFGSLLAVSTEAREAVWGWIREKYDSFFYVYSYQSTGREEKNAAYVPGWVPESWKLLGIYPQEGGESYVYEDENGGISQFSYSVEPKSLKMYIGAVDYDQHQVSVSDFEGTVYIAPDERQSSELIWSDGKTLFSVSGHEKETILLKVAENILKK